MTRRQQRMVHYGLLSVSLVLIPSLLWFLLRKPLKPYAPGEPVEGVT